MFDGVDEQLIGLLTDRRVDAILTIFETGSASKFPSRVLFEEPYVLAVPESHRFAQRKSVKLSELRGEPFIVRARCDQARDMISGRPAPSFMRHATRSCLTLKFLDIASLRKQHQMLTLSLRSNA